MRTNQKTNYIDRQALPNGKWKCYICECELEREQVTIDHFIPQYYKEIIRGLGQTNFRIACRKCNNHHKNKIHAVICNLYDMSSKFIMTGWSIDRYREIEANIIAKLKGYNSFVEEIEILC